MRSMLLPYGIARRALASPVPLTTLPCTRIHFYRKSFGVNGTGYSSASRHTIRSKPARNFFHISLQNGLCERTIAEIAGRERTIGAFINFGADWIEAGAIMYGNRAAVVVGELKGEDTMRLRQLLADLKLFEPRAEATTDIWAFLWGKLAYGSLLF